MNAIFEDFTPVQKQHVEVMRLVAESFQDIPMVLKGGTALLLAYGLERYSEDLDFDTTKQIKADARINDALRKTKFKVNEITIKKDTDTVQRWMICYTGPDGDGYLKLEVSNRPDSIDEKSYETIDSIKIYKLPTLISQKLSAMEGRSKVRDLFDVGYLAREKPEAFTNEHVEALKEITSDVTGLESRYAADHKEDPILKDEDLEELVLELAQSVEELEGKFS